MLGLKGGPRWVVQGGEKKGTFNSKKKLEKALYRDKSIGTYLRGEERQKGARVVRDEKKGKKRGGSNQTNRGQKKKNLSSSDRAVAGSNPKST